MTFDLAGAAVSEAFNRRGCLLVGPLFESAAMDALRHEMLQLFLARLGEDVTPREGSEAVVVAAYDARKTEWREAARRLPHLPALARLAGEPRVTELMRGLGLRLPVFATPPEIRVDMPEDERYRQPWHQDWRYGQASFNAVTIWTPLHDVSRREGALEVVAGSHRLGLFETKELPDPRRFVIDDPRFDASAAETMEVRFGESLVFSQLLAHRSGTNTSGRPRLSFQLRFADLLDPAFRDNGYALPTSSALVWDRTPTAQDAARIYGGM